MYRYLIEIKYNGSKYFGWQVQPNKPTVQGEINKCQRIVRNQYQMKVKEVIGYIQT